MDGRSGAMPVMAPNGTLYGRPASRPSLQDHSSRMISALDENVPRNLTLFIHMPVCLMLTILLTSFVDAPPPPHHRCPSVTATAADSLCPFSQHLAIHFTAMPHFLSGL